MEFRDWLDNLQFELSYRIDNLKYRISKSFIARFIKMNWQWLIPLPVFTFSILSFAVVYLEIAPSFDFSIDGLNHFIELFDIPIKSLGACIIITTITVSIYRTIRIDQQLKLAQISTFRSTYFDLAELYEFNYIKIDLRKNFFHIFPEASKGNIRVNENLEYSLLEIVHIVHNIKKKHSEDSWKLGQMTGLSLAGILYHENDLKANLIIECPEFKALETSEILKDLINRAKDYLTFAEFVSNFGALIEPDSFNELRGAMNELNETLLNHSGIVNRLRLDCDKTMSDLKDAFVDYDLVNPATDMFRLYILTKHCYSNGYDIIILKETSPFVNNLFLNVDQELLYFMIDEVVRLCSSRNFKKLNEKLLNTRAFKKLINL